MTAEILTATAAAKILSVIISVAAVYSAAYAAYSPACAVDVIDPAQSPARRRNPVAAAKTNAYIINGNKKPQ